MYTELRDELINYLRELPEIKKASRYRGELEEDGQWNPVMPSAFVNFTLINPAGYMSNLDAPRYKYQVDIYIADRDDAGPVVESVIHGLDETDITIEEEIYTIKIVQIQLIGYIRSIEVWNIKIELL